MLEANTAMASRYNPKDHIQPLVVAPRTEGVFDQREITIQSYQTTVPFNYGALDSGLECAWLTPQTRFGLFSRIPLNVQDAISVVLALQDELTVRAYDYDERRPLWYSWHNTIVETVNVQYFRDRQGLLRFTTTGGGRRITGKMLRVFNSAFLNIPEDATSKQQFDLERLRNLCFNRFGDRLYMIRFSDPSGKEYRSIDHALFQSKKYIKPTAERLKEIRDDERGKVESFDSDTEVQTDDLASSIRVRFFLRGLSGSLRLRFPKVPYKILRNSPEEQAVVFYRLANATVQTVLDEDYYTHQRRTLHDIESAPVLYREMVELDQYREVLSSETERTSFFAKLDLNDQWPHWSPHLQALDQLVDSNQVAAHVESELAKLVKRDPEMAARVLADCQSDPQKYRIGSMVAKAVSDELQNVPAETRSYVEGTLLSWAIEREYESWDVDVETAEFSVLNVRWRLDDLSLDAISAVTWKLVGVLHSRLIASTDDVGYLLSQFDWCMAAAKSLPHLNSNFPAALRLVADRRVPKTAAEATRTLKHPVKSLADVDAAILEQFGLPLWPLLSASRVDGMLVLSNNGIGAAQSVTVESSGEAADAGERATLFELIAGDSIPLPACDGTVVNVHFEKLDRTYRVSVPIEGESPSIVAIRDVRSPSSIINRKRIDAQCEYRKEIDPNEIVIGSTPALLKVFEQIHFANKWDELTPVLLLGEPGVGKTHFAKLLHESSRRHKQPYKEVNAGSSGGDPTIQRGEWIGYGKGHGLQGIDSKGRPGHFMSSDGGTLFVDEFVGLSPELQFVFLSALENRSLEKVGGESCTPDVRCIFATNADIDEAIASNTLRQDLVDRIPVRIQIPPLRERRADILQLAKHAAGGQGFSERARLALLQYDWPGNVRELHATVRAALTRMRIDGKEKIDLAHFELPDSIFVEVESLDDDACRRELWILADEFARDEGFDHGTGLQRRTGEILDVSESQASKMYRALGLAPAASA